MLVLLVLLVAAFGFGSLVSALLVSALLVLLVSLIGFAFVLLFQFLGSLVLFVVYRVARIACFGGLLRSVD